MVRVQRSEILGLPGQRVWSLGYGGPQITQPKKWTTCAKNLPQIFEWIFLGFPWIFHGFPWIFLEFSMDSGKKSGGRAGNRTGGRAGGNSNGLPGKSGFPGFSGNPGKSRIFFGGRRAERQKNCRSVENVTGNHFFAKKIGWEWNHHLFGGLRRTGFSGLWGGAQRAKTGPSGTNHPSPIPS